MRAGDLTDFCGALDVKWRKRRQKAGVDGHNVGRLEGGEWRYRVDRGGRGRGHTQCCCARTDYSSKLCIDLVPNLYEPLQSDFKTKATLSSSDPTTNTSKFLLNSNSLARDKHYTVTTPPTLSKFRMHLNWVYYTGLLACIIPKNTVRFCGALSRKSSDRQVLVTPFDFSNYSAQMPLILSQVLIPSSSPVTMDKSPKSRGIFDARDQMPPTLVHYRIRPALIDLPTPMTPDYCQGCLPALAGSTERLDAVKVNGPRRRGLKICLSHPFRGTGTN